MTGEEPPAVLESFPVKKEVADVDRQVEKLDEELRVLDLRREELESQKRELAKARIAALAKTAPINGMLPELYARIFELASTAEGKEGVELPIRLTEVCHTWRDIALATPRAWGKLMIEIEEDSQARPMIRRAQAFLERSKTTEIDIVFDLGSWSKTDTREALINEILELLSQNMGRCTRLVAKGRDEGDAPAILNKLVPHFGPSLVDFSIESRDSVRLQMPQMPHVRRLSIDDVGPNGEWTQGMVTNLQSLSIRYIKPIAFEQFLETLEAAQDSLEELKLSRCTLSFDSNGFLYPTQATTRTFNKLRKITLIDVLPGDIDIIFESISAPALEEIHLGLDSARFRYFKFMDASNSTALQKCSVKRLEFEECTVENSELRALLATLQSVGPTLTTLAFTAGDIDMRLYEILISEPSILPNLTRLEFRRINGDLTGRELFRLVQARAGYGRGVAPLQSLMVEKCRSFEMDMIPQIKQFVREVDFTPY